MSNEHGFPSASKAEWLAKIEKDLRGKPLDGLNFSAGNHQFTPFHHADDMTELPPPVRGPRTEPCRSGVSLAITDPAKDNKVILNLLNKGANALFLHASSVDLEKELDVILAGVYREFIHVYLLQSGDNTQPVEIISLQGTAFQADTLPEMLRDYATALESSLVPNPTYWLEVTDDYLTSIARLRAMRLCYRLIADAHGITTPCHIVADPMTKITGKHTGMIATSANVSAALVGGADTVFIPSGPSDDPKEKAFLRRVAINSLNVLEHEAYLNRVADPAAGSYYLENLTDYIARSTWASFQQLSQA